MEELESIISEGMLDFYDNLDEIKNVISEVFQLNPHSVHTLNKHKEGIYAVALDNLHIVYTMNSDKTKCEVVKIMYSDNSQPMMHTSSKKSKKKQPDFKIVEKLRTKEWLEKMMEIMDFRGFRVDDPSKFEEGSDKDDQPEVEEETI